MFGHLSMLCTKKLTLQFLFSIIRKLSSNIKTFDYVILKILSIILMWTLYEVNVTVITNFNNLNFAIFFTPYTKIATSFPLSRLTRIFRRDWSCFGDDLRHYVNVIIIPSTSSTRCTSSIIAENLLKSVG